MNDTTAALVKALEDARALVEKWCQYQGDLPEVFAQHLGPIDAALALAAKRPTITRDMAREIERLKRSIELKQAAISVLQQSERDLTARLARYENPSDEALRCAADAALATFHRTSPTIAGISWLEVVRAALASLGGAK